MPKAADSRISALLAYFSRHATATFRELAETLGVSSRTVRNDVKRLNFLLGDMATLESEAGVLALVIYDREAFFAYERELRAASEQAPDSPKSRRARLFGLIASSTSPVTMERLAQRLYMSRSTLAADLAALRDDIAPWGLSILGRENSGLVLDGNEIDIRSYIIDKAYDAIYGDRPLDGQIQDIIAKNARLISSETSIRDILVRYVTVMLDRFRRGHAIGAIDEPLVDFVETPEFSLVDRLVDDIEGVTGGRYPYKERLFVLLSIVGVRTPGDAGSVGPIELDEEVVSLVKDIVTAVHDDLNIAISFGDLSTEVLYHIKYMLNRLRCGIVLRNPLLGDMREKYPLEYEISGIAARIIRNHIGIEVPDDERGYLTAYFGVIFERLRTSSMRHLKIAVVAGSERITAHLIEAQLRKVLDSSDEVSLFTRSEVGEDVLEGFDVVLSTTPLPLSCDVPMIIVHEVFDEQEMLGRIRRAVKSGEAIYAADAGASPTIRNLLSPERFFRLEDVEDYAGGIARMVDDLIGQGCLDQGFAERLKKREQLHRMVFDHAVALPHCQQFATGDIVLALGTFPRPVACGHDLVQVIFLLGVPESVHVDESALVRVYDEIVQIVQSKTLCERLAGATTYEDAIRVLSRGEVQ